MSANLQSETSKCCIIESSSYLVKCLFPLDIGGKNRMSFSKIFGLSLAKPGFVPETHGFSWDLNFVTLDFMDSYENGDLIWMLIILEGLTSLNVSIINFYYF